MYILTAFPRLQSVVLRDSDGVICLSEVVCAIYIFTIYTVIRKKLQYISDHNFGKSQSIFTIFALL